MMEHTNLIDRIIEKCREQNWYGGDKSNTARYKGSFRYEIFYTPQGKQITIDNDPDDHPRKTSFAYAPATTEQILATERALGFPLPPILHTLYSQIANGGFGPGYGLHGVLGGFNEAGNLVDGYTFQITHAELVDLEVYAPKGLIHDPIDLPDTVWPRYLLYLCDWDYATTSCLDAVTGCVYLCRPSRINSRSFTLLLEAPSLQNWLELWLAGELKDNGQYIKNPDEQDEGDLEEQDSLCNLVESLDAGSSSDSDSDSEEPIGWEDLFEMNDDE